MKTAGWSGKSKGDVPQWVLEARKAKSVRKSNFTNGGRLRRTPNAAISLPKLRFQDGAK